MLRHLEIHQIVLDDHLRHLVPREGDHAVGDNTAVLRDADIGRSRPHIHEGNIQHAEVLRNRHVNGGDRLQRQVCHLKIRKPHRRVEPVYHVLRQKGHNDIGSHHLRLVPLQIGIDLLVDIIFHHRIAHAVKPVLCIIFLAQNPMGLLNAQKLQRVDHLSGDNGLLGVLVIHMRRHSL